MKRLGIVPMARTPYSVLEGTARELPQLEGAYGFCDEENQRLLILAGMSRNRRRRTLGHEALHGVTLESGALCFFKGEDDDERRESSENFIRVVEPHMMDAWVAVLRIGDRHA